MWSLRVNPFTIGREIHVWNQSEDWSERGENIRDFLEQVKEGKPSLLSHLFTYDPSLHCFQKETDAGDSAANPSSP